MIQIQLSSENAAELGHPLELKRPLRSKVVHEFYLVTQRRQYHMYERGLVWGGGNQTSSTVDRSGGREREGQVYQRSPVASQNKRYSRRAGSYHLLLRVSFVRN